MKKTLLLLLALLGLGVSGAWAQVEFTHLTEGDYLIYFTSNANGTNYYIGANVKGVAKANALTFHIAPVAGESGYYTIMSVTENKYLQWGIGTVKTTPDYAMNNQDDGTTVTLDGTDATSDACKWFLSGSTGSAALKMWPKGHEEGTTQPRVLIQYTSTADKYCGLWGTTSFVGATLNLISVTTTDEDNLISGIIDEADVEVRGTNGIFSRTGGGTSAWKDLWTSNATGLTVQITTSSENSAYRYDMAWTGSNGKIQMASSSDQTAYYTMTAPLGYVITGYKINGTTNGDLNVTLGDAESGTDYANGATLTNVGESGLYTKQTKFTLKGQNKTITGKLVITIKRSYMKTADELSTTKFYTIASREDRGYMYVEEGGIALTTTTKQEVSKNQLSTAQQFAFIEHEGNYYLYSVSEKKFVAKNGDYTTLTKAATQPVTITTSDVSNYFVVSFDGTSRINLSNAKDYGIFTSYETADDGNRLLLDAAGMFDPTEALNTFNVTDVTYNLYYNDILVKSLLVEGENLGATEIPAGLDNGFCTYTYTPATITNETSEVRIDATWRGPFKIASSYADADAAADYKWYVIDIHSNENNYTWQYDATSNEIQTPVIAKDAYASLTDANLWCFVGDPYNGFKIYNRAAGANMTIRKETAGNTVSYMSETNDHNAFKLYTSDAISNAYCFKLDDDSYYLNKQNMKLQGWTAADNGSSCRFFAPGTYHLAAMNSWELEAPVGAVGSKSYISTSSLRENLLEARTNITNDPFCVVGQFTTLNLILNPVRDSEVITLNNSYYRIVSAYPNFASAPAIYYNSTNDRIDWSVASNTSDNVNTIFKIDTSAPSIYSLNGGKFMSTVAATPTSGALASEAGATTFTSLGSAQYNIVIGGGTMHAAEHQSGKGTGYTLTNWSGGLNTPSAWYIVHVDDITIPLTHVGDYSYATLYLPFGVTIEGAQAYILTVDGSVATPVAVNEVPANTGVLLRAEGNVESVIATIKDAASAETEDNKLAGTCVDITSDRAAGEYILGVSDGQVGFYMRKSGRKIGANKAYLNLGADVSGESAVKGIRLNFDMTDTINDISNRQSNCDAEYYDLSGRRISQPSKGLYIVGGKKVVVK